MLTLFLASVAVMVASLVGVIAVWNRAGTFIEKNLGLLVSFSAGVFLVIAYHLATEALEHAASAALGVSYIFAGALFLWVLSKLLPSAHTHAVVSGERPIDARRVLVSDSVHNVGDGVLLAASFAISPALGFATTISVFIHELVQELSEFFVLRSAGYSTSKALLTNFLVSSTILVGAVLGFFLLESMAWLEAPIVGVAAGMLLVVLLHDLIPHSLRNASGLRHGALHLVWGLAGVVLMGFLAALLGH